MMKSSHLIRAEAAAQDAAARLSLRTAALGNPAREARLARTWHLVRASVPGTVNNLVYALGSGDQCLGALGIDPITLLGFKACGAISYPWLLEAAEADPGGTFIDHVRAALADPERDQFCVELGAFHRFQWKRSVLPRKGLALAGEPTGQRSASCLAT